MPPLTNNERIRQVAEALAELNKEVVYVGGAVIQLYTSDPATQNPMTTYDVDCVVDVSSYKDYHLFEEKLLARRFTNDTSEGAPICRYLFNGEKVDFMPKVDTGIGESNRWYQKGMKYRLSYRLDDKTTIFLMPSPFYLASKFDALHSRGGNDFRGEKDFEDIVFVVNGCNHLVEDIRDSAESDVVLYLKAEMQALLGRVNINEEIECALSEEGRLRFVLRQMQAIAEIEKE